VKGGIKTVGNSSITTYYEMNNKVTGKLAATLTAKTVYFDLDARKSTPITPEMRERMAGFILAE
jgi:acyl-CoA thioester hydrolase